MHEDEELNEDEEAPIEDESSGEEQEEQEEQVTEEAIEGIEDELEDIEDEIEDTDKQEDPELWREIKKRQMRLRKRLNLLIKASKKGNQQEQNPALEPDPKQTEKAPESKLLFRRSSRRLKSKK